MQKVELKVKTITPLFLAGVDQETAELRAPSFRGLMRYWHRALVGGLMGGLDDIIKAETEIFGATDTGSPFSIRVSPPDKKPQQFTEAITKWVGNEQKATGKGYLLWSMRLKKPSRYYFDKNTHFQISLAIRDTDSEKQKRIIAALWLLLRLGAVGSRSRRCAGSLEVQSFEGNTYDFPFGIPANVDALQGQIKQGIDLARKLYQQQGTIASPPRFDIMSRAACRIWILHQGQPWNTSDDAMRDIGMSLQNLRASIPIHKRKVFGFPLRGVRGTVERRASPLMLRIAELQENKFVVVAVLFKTVNSDVASMNDYKEIEQWAATFRGVKEVAL